MADIVVTASRVSVVFPEFAEIYPAISAVALTRGALVYFNSSGKLALSDASGAGTALVDGMALETVGANQGCSILIRGHVAGFTIASLAPRATLYLSDTNTGIMADAAGTVSVAVGKVWPMSDPSLTEVVYFVAPSWV